MRVFTDGSCRGNGRAGAKAGFAAWFPDHPSWSSAKRVPDTDPQTNQRAELSAIQLAVDILEERGEYDCDLVIYSDSDYSIKCLTIWLQGWMRRGWKTAEGKDVLHQDLIKDITGKLSKFKSHRFHHVRAHTGNLDDLSVQNDVVDRMATAVVEGKEVVAAPPPVEVIDELFPGCPLRIMGPPCSQKNIVDWVKNNLSTMDSEIVDKHMFKIFTEMCKTRDVNLTKQIIQKQPVIRAERGHLQIESIDKVE
jgi:ribonuclease HI